MGAREANIGVMRQTCPTNILGLGARFLGRIPTNIKLKIAIKLKNIGFMVIFRSFETIDYI